MSDLIGVAFWIFVAVVVVAALWYAQARNREKQRTIRLAMEKGVPLDAALIEALDKRKPARPEDYYIGGYICAAAGIGLIPFGFFIKQVETAAFYPLLGAGILTLLIGLSLILVAGLIKRRNERDKNGNPGM